MGEWYVPSCLSSGQQLGPDPVVLSHLCPVARLVHQVAGDDNEGGFEAIDGGNGDDGILAGNGNDFVQGGAGADLIVGGDGADQLLGGGGIDTLLGGGKQKGVRPLDHVGQRHDPQELPLLIDDGDAADLVLPHQPGDGGLRRRQSGHRAAAGHAHYQSIGL